jgi:hypothetical protein
MIRFQSDGPLSGKKLLAFSGGEGPRRARPADDVQQTRCPCPTTHTRPSCSRTFVSARTRVVSARVRAKPNVCHVKNSYHRKIAGKQKGIRCRFITTFVVLRARIMSEFVSCSCSCCAKCKQAFITRIPVESSRAD